MVVVEMTVSWLDADGLHLVECEPHKRKMGPFPGNGVSILSAVLSAGEAAKEAVLQELAKRG